MRTVTKCVTENWGYLSQVSSHVGDKMHPTDLDLTDLLALRWEVDGWGLYVGGLCIICHSSTISRTHQYFEEYFRHKSLTETLPCVVVLPLVPEINLNQRLRLIVLSYLCPAHLYVQVLSFLTTTPALMINTVSSVEECKYFYSSSIDWGEKKSFLSHHFGFGVNLIFHYFLLFYNTQLSN